MEYPKATIIEWEQDVDVDLYWLYDEFQVAKEMFANKTDFIQEKVNSTTVRRIWVDQDSAQAWIDFVTEVANRHQVNIVSATIVDVT